MAKFKLAVSQLKPRLGDLKWNLQHHLEAAERAARSGAEVIVFPELGLTGYSLRDLNSEVAIGAGDKLLNPLRSLSRKVSMAVGAVIRDDKGGIRNSLLYLEDGMVKHIHHKVYLPTYGIFEEQRYFLPGRKVESFETKFGRMGLLICEDLWHISLPYILALQGARVILAAAASPTRLGGDGGDHPGQKINSEHHRTLSRLLSIYTAFTNRVGFEDGVNFWGGSEVISPHGEVLASCKLYEEDSAACDVDLSEVDRARLFARHFLDEDPGLLIAHLRSMGY